MQRQQTFVPNQNNTPPDGDDHEESGGQWAIFDGTQAASSSKDFDRAIEDGGRSRPGTSVAAVRDEPANQQLPHAHEEILPAPENGPSVASEASVTLLPTETQEASDINNVPNFSFQIAGCLCVQGEQIPQVETSTFEDFLRYTNSTAEQSSSTQTGHYFALVLEATQVYLFSRPLLSFNNQRVPFPQNSTGILDQSQNARLIRPVMVAAHNQDSSSRYQQSKIQVSHRRQRFLCHEMHSQQGSVKSHASFKKTEAGIFQYFRICVCLCV